jgi:hypothetical protein
MTTSNAAVLDTATEIWRSGGHISLLLLLIQNSITQTAMTFPFSAALLALGHRQNQQSLLLPDTLRNLCSYTSKGRPVQAMVQCQMNHI